MLDSDDLFLPHHLAAAVEILDVHPHSAVYSRIVVDRGKFRTFLKPPRSRNESEHIAEYLLCGRGFIPTSTLILPTVTACEVRYDERLTLQQPEDTDFDIRLFNAGVDFTMIDSPSAIWLDHADPGRVSGHRSAAARQAWLDSIAATIPRRAYLGDRGWFIARCHAHEGRLGLALRLYLEALVKGAFEPPMAMIVALQVLLSGQVYRGLADGYLRLRGLFGR